MTPGAAQRTVALGGVALIAVIVALALTGSPLSNSNDDPDLPQPVRTWYNALAAPYTPPASRDRTTCGQRTSSRLMGVAHPVLPCGVRLFIAFRGTRVLTQVVDRGPSVPGRDFDITKPLADRIELHGTQPIRWTYAQ